MFYISDIIGEDYKTWKPNDVIFLCGQTGTGKTTFIMGKLLKYASAQKPSGKVVYVCNRRTLYEQVSESINPSRGNLPNDGSVEGNFRLFTYQEIEQNQANFWAAINTDQRVYLIFDEAHYITQDSLFNRGTHYWREIITQKLNYSRNCVKIIITATPDEILPYLYSNIEGESMLQRAPDSSEIYDWNQIKKENNRILRKATENIYKKLNDWQLVENRITFYPPLTNGEFSALDYSYVTPFLYEDDGELVEEITEKHKDENTRQEKWLIFVERIERGSDMKSELSKLCPDMRVVFLNAKQRKDQKTAETEQAYIREKQQISCDVLITTSVLINGVSLKDSNIENIVLPYTEKVELLQALGRIRINPSHSVKINAYFPKHSYREIITKKMVLKRDLTHLIQSINTQNPILVSHRSKSSRKEYILADYRFSYNHGNRMQTILSQLDARGFPKITKFLYEAINNDPPNKDDINFGIIVIRGKFRINQAALFHALYTYMQYENVLSRYHQMYLSETSVDTNREYKEEIIASPSEKSCFFFKEQLRWLGLSDNCEIIERIKNGSIRISFERKNNELMQLIKKYEDCPIEKDEQEQFRMEMYGVLKYLSPDVFYFDRFRYGEKGVSPGEKVALPGKKRLNDALKTFHFEIVAVYKNRKTTWYLKRTADSETEQEN